MYDYYIPEPYFLRGPDMKTKEETMNLFPLKQKKLEEIIQLCES